MKASKRILSWIIISLLLQFSVYIYLDKVYYADENNIQYSEANSADTEQNINPNVTFTSDAENIALSDDLSYTAYMSNGHVVVVDTNTGKAKENLNYNSGVKCLAYKWVPTTDRLIIAEELNGSEIRFFSYDASTQVKSEIDDELNKKKNSIPAASTIQMRISDLTGLLYIKAGYSATRDSIYRIDRNETLTRTTTVMRNIGNFALASDDDQLAYEDLATGTIRTNYLSKKISIPGTLKPGIIGTDANDNFYIGNGIQASSKVYYGKLTNSTSSWKSVSLGKNVNNSNIVITQDGNIYIFDKESSTVVNAKSNKSYSYEGNFCEINGSYIVYDNNNKLMLKKMQ